MVLIRPALLATFIATGATSVAYAAPMGTIVPLAAAPVQATLVQYGYGPRPYGAYGYRRYRFGPRRSYGTGYRGRGTATGGPVGGLPSRN